jgi:hypothetical protein
VPVQLKHLIELAKSPQAGLTDRQVVVMEEKQICVL